MKKRYVILLSFVLIITFFWLGMEAERFSTSLNEIGEPLETSKRIYFPQHYTSLYFKKQTWGITGNHNVIWLSAQPIKENLPDSLKTYIFKGAEDLIYKAQGDTLHIYSFQVPKKPIDFDSPIKIEFIKLNNYDDWQNIHNQLNNSYHKFE